MVKKRKKAAQNRVAKVSGEDKLFSFVLGIMLFFVLEIIFMLGGLYFEKSMLQMNATGIPSLLGLIVWCILASAHKDKRELFLGGLAISVLVPIILIIVTMTGFVAFSNIMYGSIAAFILVELWTAFVLMKKK